MDKSTIINVLAWLYDNTQHVLCQSAGHILGCVQSY